MKRTVHGVVLVGGQGHYTTEDGRYEISLDDNAITWCDNPHPVREARGRGYQCPGGQEHSVPLWNAWDTVAHDHVGGETGYDTMGEAVRALATAISEVPDTPTVGTDCRDPDVVKLLSIGHEAMITIANDSGAVTFHPDIVAFGDSEKGQILVPGWRGAMWYQRGRGTAGGKGWWLCLGDVICKAIAEGRIPLHPPEDRPV